MLERDDKSYTFTSAIYWAIQERSKDLHMVFPNLEKTDDKVLREVLWWTMIKKRVLIKYINIIKDMWDT